MNKIDEELEEGANLDGGQEPRALGTDKPLRAISKELYYYNPDFSG